MLLPLILNIQLFPWHINTATCLGKNNTDEHTAGRLAILNADLHTMFSFDSLVVLKISKKNQFADGCYKHFVFFFYNSFWKKFQQIIRQHIDSKDTISSNSTILIPKQGYWKWLGIITVTFEKRI